MAPSITVVVRKSIRGRGLLARLCRRCQMLARPQEATFASRWSAHFFGHLEIARQYQWAGRDEQRYEVFVRCGREVACRLKVMERTILIDDQPIKIGAIAGLMTAPAWQKRGLARKALAEARSLIFRQMKAQMAGLLCLPEVADFYRAQGWRSLECPVWCLQDGKETLWPGCFMIFSEAGEEWSPTKVHLCGLPF